MNDLRLIKKYYGEKMMHLCRELFPFLLEKENLLFSLLKSHFDYSKQLCDDIIENNMVSNFQIYIYSLLDINNGVIITDKEPQILLKEAGYTLFECHTEEEIQEFKKYYAEGEELCTFRNNRLDSCYVFFAVKMNIDEIKREMFSNPTRDDMYGTSVISLQFQKNSNILSIKNRYNHTVDNPDATFSNNLENIAIGLTYSFAKKYGFDLKAIKNSGDFNMNRYVVSNKNKRYKYNYEINDVYYGPNNNILDKSYLIHKYKDTSIYLQIDYFVLDLKRKKIFYYDRRIQKNESFVKIIGDIKSIEIFKKNSNKIIKLVNVNGESFTMAINEENKLIFFQCDSLKEIPNNFLFYNVYLESILLPNVEKIGNNFLYKNAKLKDGYFPLLDNAGFNFLQANEKFSDRQTVNESAKVKTL